MRTKMKAGGSKTAGDCKNKSKNRCGVYPDCYPCTSQKIAAGIFAGGLSAMAGTKVAQRLKGIKDEKDKEMVVQLLHLLDLLRNKNLQLLKKQVQEKILVRKVKTLQRLLPLQVVVKKVKE